MKEHAMNVHQLIKAISKCDPAAMVDMEGCDCNSRVFGVYRMDDGEILLGREEWDGSDFPEKTSGKYTRIEP